MKATHPSARPTSSTRSLLFSVSRDFAVGMAALLVVLVLKFAFERSTWGEGMERWIYAQLVDTLNGNELERVNGVQVVDLSAVSAQPMNLLRTNGETWSLSVTPRAKLLELLRALTHLRPRPLAIGVDIDFSPLEDGQPVTPGDLEFFKTVLTLKEQEGVPIYLGVQRQRWEKSTEWLGDAAFKTLAAGFAIPEEPETRYYVRWQRGTNADEALPNFSLALNGFPTEETHAAHPRWAWAVHAAELRAETPETRGGTSPGIMCWALADYRALGPLEEQTLYVQSPQTITENASKFARRIVILGDCSKPEHDDHFVISELRRPAAGCYLHACAALTASGHPILELTASGRLAIDIAVSVAIMAGISAIRLFYAYRRPAAVVQVPWLYGFLTVCAILASVLIAVGLIKYTRVIWTDFIAVSLGLVLHLYIHHHLGHLPGWLSRHAIREDGVPAAVPKGAHPH